jgi:TonB family protein
MEPDFFYELLLIIYYISYVCSRSDILLVRFSNRIRYQMEGSMKKLSGTKAIILTGLMLLLIIPFSWTKSQADQPMTTDSLVSSSGAVIKGTVWDKNNSLLNNALIIIKDSPYSARTDENGIFEIHGIPAGPCTLQIFWKDSKVYEFPFRVFNEKDIYKLNFDLDLKINPEKSKPSNATHKENESAAAQSQIMGRIFGTVTDRETGLALAGANLIVADTKQGTATDASGHYLLSLEPCTASIQASFIGYSSILVTDVIVREGQSLKIDLALQPSAIPYRQILKRERKLKNWNVEESSPLQNKKENPDSSSYVAFDISPEPVGGLAELQKKIIYPKTAQEGKIEGKVIVQAEINEYGTVSQTRVVQSLEPSGCDIAAENAVQSVSWKPAMLDGKPVKAWITIPIVFKLN